VPFCLAAASLVAEVSRRLLKFYDRERLRLVLEIAKKASKK
jgi:hypothetical protein